MLALQLIRDEFAKMSSQPVSAEELQTAKSSFLETFPRTFESKGAMLGVFVSDEWTGRDPAYWQNYRANIDAVTAEKVQAVAKRLLDPAQMAVFVVGDWDTIAPGDATGRASLAKTFNDQASELPLRDPMTMQPMK
jgi:zinc protease